jgi:deoxyribodipyrimidine photo-lyase
MKGLFVFRRDLRVYDNLGLIELLTTCQEVYCIFILDPKQISKADNPYFSPNAFLFMLDTLIELKKTISLTILQGDPILIIKKIIATGKIDVVSFNADYSKYSVERDTKIQQLQTATCKVVATTNDLTLNSPMSIKPYKVFTPYHVVAVKNRVALPIKPTSSQLEKIKKLPTCIVSMVSINNTADINKLHASTKQTVNSLSDISLIQHGGREAGLACIKHFKCLDYNNRDFLTYESSRLSPHLKFGTVSCREVYHSCKNALFRKQLYWRDFYLQISYHFPHVYSGNYKGKITRYGSPHGVMAKLAMILSMHV